MTDMFKPQERSLIMSKIKSKGNALTELRFIKILEKNNITGWESQADLPGKPDFMFSEAKLIVFVDSDFWHGNPKKFRLPKSNLVYWEKKINGNRRRDRQVNRILRKSGWKVYRFWQSSLKNEKIVVSRLRRGLKT